MKIILKHTLILKVLFKLPLESRGPREKIRRGGFGPPAFEAFIFKRCFELDKLDSGIYILIY